MPPKSMALMNFQSILTFITSLKCDTLWEVVRTRIVVWLLSHVQLFATSWIVARQASSSFAISRSLLKFMSTESVMPSNHLILCWAGIMLPK